MLRELIGREGVDPEDIVVLSDSRRFVDEVHYRRQVAGRRLVPLGGDGIAVETISRFKGLEAKVVVLLLTSAWSEASTRVAPAYAGMTRARAHLVVLADGLTLARAGLQARVVPDVTEEV